MTAREITKFQGWGIAVLRVVTGTIFLVRGVQKLFILDLSTVADFLARFGSPLPFAVAAVVAVVELACGAALVLGFRTRWVSVPLALGMLVDVLLIHGPQGFSVQQGGYEYALLRLAATVALVFAGPGKMALDNILASRRRSKHRSSQRA